MTTLADIIAANAAWAPAYVPVGIFVGGTSGIGQGIAEAFARHTHGRAHIVLVGRNEAAAAAILARLPAASSGEVYTREFISCDLAFVANAKRTSAQLAARFPRVNIIFLTAGAISLKGFDPTPEEGIDRQMASLYYSKWAFIDGILPSLRAAKQAGEDARVAAVHTAGRGIPLDLEDLGLEKGLQRGVRGARSLVGQLASYQDLMAEVRSFSPLLLSSLPSSYTYVMFRPSAPTIPPSHSHTPSLAPSTRPSSAHRPRSRCASPTTSASCFAYAAR
jgi:NAD(P)-dependent dehydrogenase (short-subunit alcohol dehydrogenase family)